MPSTSWKKVLTPPWENLHPGHGVCVNMGITGGHYLFLIFWKIYVNLVGLYVYLVGIYANLVGIYANLVGNYADLLKNA